MSKVALYSTFKEIDSRRYSARQNGCRNSPQKRSLSFCLEYAVLLVREADRFRRLQSDSPDCSNSQGPPINLPALGDTFQSYNHFRIMTIAHSIQNNWLSYAMSIVASNTSRTMVCSRSHNSWSTRVGGKCRFKIRAVERSDGVVEVVAFAGEHSHPFDGMTATRMPLLFVNSFR